MRIAFIGGGNMAEALLAGLTRPGATGGLGLSGMVVSDPVATRRGYLSKKFGVDTVASNHEAVTGSASVPARPAHVLILAVKPQHLKSVALDVAPWVQQHQPLVVSIAAGIRSTDLLRWLSTDAAATGSSSKTHTSSCPLLPLSIVRAMPNTPALVLLGATGLYANPSVTEKEKDLAFKIMSAVSPEVYWVTPESHLDIVTACSGSGPAYFFYVIQHMIEASVKLGLPLDVARGLAAQTCLGAGQMVLSNPQDSVADLRRKVTSPSGTTEAGVNVLQARNVGAIIHETVAAAEARSRELGNLYQDSSDSNKL